MAYVADIAIVAAEERYDGRFQARDPCFFLISRRPIWPSIPFSTALQINFLHTHNVPQNVLRLHYRELIRSPLTSSELVPLTVRLLLKKRYS